MLAVAGLGKAFMNARNRKAMLEGADANEGFIDMLPTGPFIRRKPRMMTAQDMANDPMFIDAMAAKGGRIMKTKKDVLMGRGVIPRKVRNKMGYMKNGGRAK